MYDSSKCYCIYVYMYACEQIQFSIIHVQPQQAASKSSGRLRYELRHTRAMAIEALCVNRATSGGVWVARRKGGREGGRKSIVKMRGGREGEREGGREGGRGGGREGGRGGRREGGRKRGMGRREGESEGGGKVKNERGEM